VVQFDEVVRCKLEGCRVPFPMGSLEFFIDLMALRSTQPLRRMSKGQRRPLLRAKSLNLLTTSKPFKVRTGIAYSQFKNIAAGRIYKPGARGLETRVVEYSPGKTFDSQRIGF
jgi:hypothetical protein